MSTASSFRLLGSLPPAGWWPPLLRDDRALDPLQTQGDGRRSAVGGRAAAFIDRINAKQREKQKLQQRQHSQWLVKIWPPLKSFPSPQNQLMAGLACLFGTRQKTRGAMWAEVDSTGGRGAAACGQRCPHQSSNSSSQTTSQPTGRMAPFSCYKESSDSPMALLGHKKALLVIHLWLFLGRRRTTLHLWLISDTQRKKAIDGRTPEAPAGQRRY